MRRRFGILLGTLGAGAFALAAAGASNSAQNLRTAKPFRPQPQATVITGNSSGPLFYVENDGTAAFNAFGIIGAVGGGPDAIGVIGYGTNAAQGNIGTLGYDLGPSGIAGAGYAAYPTQTTTTLANQTVGLEGLANNGNGVVGETFVFHANSGLKYAGVVGIDGTGNQFNDGVLGQTSGGGWGVEGLSGDNASGGVHGLGTTGPGVQGESTATYGVYGTSNTYAGVYGLGSTSSSAGVLAVAPYVALEAQCAPSSTCFPLALFDSTGASVFNVDYLGNVNYHGGLTHFVRTRSGNVGRTYAPVSTMSVLEDFGSGRVVNGAGLVRVDPAFADMSDGSGYEVFLTPKGDSNGLYVSNETPGSFEVRESHGGRSSLAFDYRIVAKQNGRATERASIAKSESDFTRVAGHAPLVPISQSVTPKHKGSRYGLSVPNTQTIREVGKALANGR